MGGKYSSNIHDSEIYDKKVVGICFVFINLEFGLFTCRVLEVGFSAVSFGYPAVFVHFTYLFMLYFMEGDNKCL